MIGNLMEKTNLRRIAMQSASGPTKVTWEEDPICCLVWSSIANTIGSDIFTREPSFILRELKCKVCKYWSSLIKPLNGLAQPSLITCTHSRSIFVSFMFGSEPASNSLEARSLSGTTRSINVPPSGSIKELLMGT